MKEGSRSERVRASGSREVVSPYGETVLVVGGYGEVGRAVCEEVARLPNVDIVVGGRTASRAQAVADALPAPARPVCVDARDNESLGAVLNRVDCVVNCVEDPEFRVLDAAIKRGLVYVDVSAAAANAEAARRRDRVAEANSARAVIGCGVAPGLLNLLAARACTELDAPTERVDTVVLLSLGDQFGAAAAEYMLRAAAEPFRTAGPHKLTVHAFDTAREFEFPSPLGLRASYRFAFPDQFGYRRTLGARSAGSWVCFEPGWLGHVLRGLARVRLTRVFGARAVRRAVGSLMVRASRHVTASPRFGLLAQASSDACVANAALVGERETAATALAACLALDTLRCGNVPAGCWLPEEVFELDAWLPALEDRGMHLAFAIHPSGGAANVRGSAEAGNAA